MGRARLILRPVPQCSETGGGDVHDEGCRESYVCVLEQRSCCVEGQLLFRWREPLRKGELVLHGLPDGLCLCGLPAETSAEAEDGGRHSCTPPLAALLDACLSFARRVYLLWAAEDMAAVANKQSISRR